MEARSGRLVEKIDRLRAQMAMLKVMEAEVEASPDGQVSLTDPDARAMATSGRGSGMVGYNVQSAVEGEHHLIVAHEVLMTGSDREQLASMAAKAKERHGRGGARCAGRPGLLLRRGDPGLRDHGRDALRAQAPDVQAPRRRAASASRTSSTCPIRTSTAARPARCCRAT